MQPAGAKIPLIDTAISVLWISVGKVLPSFARVRQVIAFEQVGCFG
jgi:hypothetical protein